MSVKVLLASVLLLLLVLSQPNIDFFTEQGPKWVSSLRRHPWQHHWAPEGLPGWSVTWVAGRHLRSSLAPLLWSCGMEHVICAFLGSHSFSWPQIPNHFYSRIIMQTTERSRSAGNSIYCHNYYLATKVTPRRGRPPSKAWAHPEALTWTFQKGNDSIF